MTYNGISQILNDTVTCIPNPQLKKAINLIEKGKVMASEIELKDIKIKTLEEVVKLQDKALNTYKAKDSTLQSMIMGYKRFAENDLATIKNLKKSETLYQSQLRRQKAKKWVMLIAGIGVGYLIKN